jgi:hypothetical protein
MIYVHNITNTPIITAIMKIHHNFQIYISIYVTGLNTLHRPFVFVLSFQERPSEFRFAENSIRILYDLANCHN